MNSKRSAAIDAYLLGEMVDTVRDGFESELLTSDELFYDVAERENEMVDAFVHGSMENSLQSKFRDSLAKFPARREKVANAWLLQKQIELSRSYAKETAKVPWYRRLGFAFQTPALAAAAMGLLLIGTIGFLLVRNRDLNQQLAAANNSNQSLNELRQREVELSAELEALRAAGSDLTTDLESERERRTALEAELSELRKRIDSGKPENGSPLVPTIATLVLRPMGPRGGPGTVRTLRLDEDVRRVALKVVLPEGRSDGTFSVRINDIAVSSDIKPNKEPGGSSSVTVTVPSDSFRSGLNRVEVVDSDSQNVASFAVLTERGPVR